MIDILCSKLPVTFCEIDQLAAILLCFCRDHVEQLRQAYDRDEVCGLICDHSEEIQLWLEDEIHEDWLDDQELAAVAALLRQVASSAGQAVPPEQAAVVAARAFAEALDGSHGRRFAGVFRGRGTTMVNAGDPIPVPQPPLKELFGSALGTNPARLGPRLWDMVWLRLLPDVARGQKVRLDFQHQDILADLTTQTRVAVIIPCDVLADLCFDRIAEPTPRFYGVRPRDSDKQRVTVLRLLEHAADAGARIVILPELSVDASCLDAIAKWHAHTEHGMAIVVCGSTHAERDGSRRNVSVTMLPDGTTIEHYKFNPFYFPLPAADGSVANHREDIVTVPSIITIHMCGDWSFSTLICKDFLEPGVAQILEEAMVRMVLVPACSPKTSVFEQIAGLLAVRAQAIVIVANLADPSSLNPSSVIIARPTHTRTVEQLRRSEIATPSIHLFDLIAQRTRDS